MRFYFLILLSIFLVSLTAVITVNKITGNIAVVADCPARCTYFPFETREDLARIQDRIAESFYIYGIYHSPSFDSESEYVLCACLKD